MRLSALFQLLEKLVEGYCCFDIKRSTRCKKSLSIAYLLDHFCVEWLIFFLTKCHNSSVKSKICGIANLEVARHVLVSRPDAIGVYCWVNPEKAVILLIERPLEKSFVLQLNRGGGVILLNVRR